VPILLKALAALRPKDSGLGWAGGCGRELGEKAEGWALQEAKTPLDTPLGS
jgi:hypothetical protein